MLIAEVLWGLIKQQIKTDYTEIKLEFKIYKFKIQKEASSRRFQPQIERIERMGIRWRAYFDFSLFTIHFSLRRRRLQQITQIIIIHH